MLRSSKPGIACKSDGGFDSRPPPPPGSSTLARPGFDEVNATHRSERPVQVPHGRERPRVTSSDLAAVLCSSGPIGSYPRSDGAVKSRLVGCGVSSVSTARHDEAQPESHRSPLAREGLSNPEIGARLFISPPHGPVPLAQGVHQAEHHLAGPARKRPTPKLDAIRGSVTAGSHWEPGQKHLRWFELVPLGTGSSGWSRPVPRSSRSRPPALAKDRSPPAPTSTRHPR